MFKRIPIQNIADENNISEEQKIYAPGKCLLCGKQTEIDQFDFCKDCSKKLVKLDVPLLTIVPIPYIKIDAIKIPKACKAAIESFKEVMKEED